MLARAIALAGLVLLSCRDSGAPGIREALASEPVAGGVAVVELFTSEGCSSCPPADSLLVDLANRDPRVLTLELHVDYWDDLGWPDPFASSDFTSRQDRYARAFQSRGLFTPQMIVNGTDSFTGSDRAHADSSVDRELSHAAGVPITIRVRAPDGASVVVEYTAPNAPPGAVINVALVQRSASVDVRAGENSGRRLDHTHIVRDLVASPIRQGGGVAVVKIPQGLSRAQAEVIAFVQGAPTRGGGIPILGGARASLPP